MTGNDDDQSFGWRTALPLILLAGGVLLVLASFLLPSGAINTSSWTPAEAKQYQAASIKLHGLSHATVHATADQQQALHRQLEEAQTEYNAIREKLDTSIDRPHKMALILRPAGFPLLAVGGTAPSPPRKSRGA